MDFVYGCVCVEGKSDVAVKIRHVLRDLHMWTLYHQNNHMKLKNSFYKLTPIHFPTPKPCPKPKTKSTTTLSLSLLAFTKYHHK